MNIEHLLKKYLEEPKKQRDKIPVETRLEYSDIKDSYKKYIIIGLSFPLTLFIFYLFSLVHTTALFWSLAWLNISLLYYQYDRRKCSECNQKMLRQNINNTLFYFCDNCKTKTKIHIGTDAGS